MTTKYYECPICIDQDKKLEDLYEDEVDLRHHISIIHPYGELLEYIMEREHPYDIDDLTRRNIVKSSVPERPYGKTILSPLELSEENRNVELEEPSGSVSEEGNIRRIVRDEMHKVLRREHLQK